MNLRKHPIWAAVFGASYMRTEAIVDCLTRVRIAVSDANGAVGALAIVDHEARDAEEEGRTGEPVTFEQKSKDTVEDILEMFCLYNNYPVRYRSNSGLLLDIVRRFDPEVARRLEDGEDPRSLSDRREDDEDET